MKKFAAFMLSFVVLLNIGSVFSLNSVNAKESESTYNFELIENLKINENINSDGNALVTRAEYVAMVVRAANAANAGKSDNSFEDVDGDMPFANEIYSAKTLGITNGTSESNFSPNEPVNKNAALKMIMIAMGYEHMATVYGGFPVGYNILEGQLDLLDGTSDGDILTVNDAKQIITNALKEDVATFSEIVDDNISFTVSRGKNLLTEKFKLKNITGVVTKAGHLSLDASINNDESVIISAFSCKTAIPFEKYFGMKVSAWINPDNNTIYAAEKALSNVEFTVDADDVIECKDGELKIYSDNKQKSLYMDASVSFMKNGRFIAHSDSDYKFTDGTLRLVDNNGDRKYDYVFAQVLDYFVIESIDFANKIIYDSNSSLKYVDLTSDVDKYSIISDIYGNTVDFSALKTGCAIEVYQSDDKSICRLVYDDINKADGIAGELSDESVVMNGKEYRFNSYFTNLNKTVYPGTNYSFILAPDGTITAIDSKSASRTEYGYFLGIAYSAGLDSEVKIKLLTSGGKVTVFNLEDNIMFDGEGKTSKSSSIIRSTFLNENGTFNYQLIKYKLNKDGKISVIDTNDKSLKSDWIVSDSAREEDNLTQYLDNKKINIYYGNGFAVPGFSLTKSIVFVAPPEVKLSPGTSNYDDEKFTVVPYSTLENDVDHNLDVFDFDSSYCPSAVVVYETMGAETSTSTAGHVILSVNDAINANGEATKVINSYSAGRYHRNFVSLEKLDEITLPKSGDVVRYERNFDGEITKITIDITAYGASDDIRRKINHSRGYVSTLNYISGKVKSFKDGNLVLVADEKQISLINDSSIAPLPLGTTPRYVVYDISDKTATVIDASGIKTADLVGEALADYVVCRMRYYAVNDVIIYRQ